jgi:2-dehydro-3-deoxyphosphogluconate aldolase/(4S)-4-hydroxy-2-oxoglutarate aldolase
MTRAEVRDSVQRIGIVPSIRVSSSDDALFAAGEIASAGIPILEITMTVPGAVELIASLVRKHPDLIVGAGTVLDRDTATRCLDAGASFLTSPGFDPAIVEFALSRDVLAIPGALTPSEVMMAAKTGADFIKIFPCSELGGPRYIKDLRGPFPHIFLIASGGVNQETAGDFILAGATAIGVGGALIPQEAIERRQPHRIHELARRFLHIVSAARTKLAGVHG